jgi:hypothetical protein
MAPDSNGPISFSIREDFCHGLLVLLCYTRFGPQKGQQGSCRSMAAAMAARSEAMETGL